MKAEGYLWVFMYTPYIYTVNILHMNPYTVCVATPISCLDKLLVRKKEFDK